ncbi:Zinc-type alcohol dehydrogenase-like protein PB24D3.08c [Mycena kentingensis (nom. inval.)]|nr:Zinc-type alcohol dehydrogenase-like protein PB24D3.08c [Mycena kentingensis (nom. inval.)]
MPPTPNARVIYASLPANYPVAGETMVHDTTAEIDLENAPLNGGFLLKTLVLSIDPYMRGKMRSPEKKSYSPAFVIGEPLYGYGIGVVLRSENPGVAVGKYVYSGEIPHQQYTIFPASFKTFRFIEKHPKLSLTTYVGAAGMPGQTAYMGWKEFSKAKPGETAFITTGGGPVGSFVIQLAKKDGLEVIGSAGSEEKVEFMKSIGADVAFNYKTIDTREVLKEAGGIDIYWDNVGGDMLDAALEYSNVYGRFLQCGMVSGNNTGMIPIKNLNQTYIKSLTLSGILVLRLLVKYEEEFYAVVPEMLASGEIKYTEEVTRGLETVGRAIERVQRGLNTAKAVVVVADE